MSRSVLSACLLLAVGCASMKAHQDSLEAKQKEQAAKESTAGQPKPKGRMVCRMERETGSNFMDKVCTYVDAPNAESSPEDAQEAIRRQQQNAVQAGANHGS